MDHAVYLESVRYQEMNGGPKQPVSFSRPPSSPTTAEETHKMEDPEVRSNL